MRNFNWIWLFLIFGYLAYPIHTQAQGNFRIFPYLQIAESNKVQIRWFADQAFSSSITLKNSEGIVLIQSPVQGKEISDLYYTSVEKSQTIAGLEGQNWIGSDKYFRFDFSYQLPYDELITYEVTLNGQVYSSSFQSGPDPSQWQTIRFIALSDSETDPKGRINRRAWYPGQPLFRPFTIPALWKQKFGTTLEQGYEIPNYFLTEKQGYAENLKIVNTRNPDFLLMPGDLVQSGAYMPAWDEFWRFNAGEYAKGLSSYPIVPGLGNWESDGGINGGYGFNEKGKFNPIVGRSRFHAFFEFYSGEAPKQRQSYYRTDYGPITVLTLDSSNGTPEQKRSDFSDSQKLKGKDYIGPGTDTQENYTQAQYEAAGGTDLGGFGSGSAQYQWLESNLKDAKQKGRLIFVQYHHIAFSSGEHGVPINHELSTGQDGTPMRILHPLLEEYGVIAVLSGHDELFERSFVDENGDGKGVHYYDVGVAGDGMRGVKRDWLNNPLQTLDYNQYSKWTADQKSTEQWNTSGANPVLSDGGKHYGHLEVNLKKIKDGDKYFAQIDFEPVYAFPVLDQNYNFLRVERRVYNDPVRILVELSAEVLVPVFKKEITVELNSEGKAVTTLKDYLENAPLEDWKAEFSRSLEYTCSDLAGTENEIKLTDSNGNSWTQVVLVKVLDKIPPDFEATDANLPFDKTIGKVVVDAESFYIRTDFITENCLNPSGVQIDLSINEITCADLKPDGSYEPKSVTITMTDRSGNATSKVRKVNLNVFESKKVSITLSAPVLSQPVTLTLGNELGYSVKYWKRIFQGVTEVFLDQKGKTFVASLPGTYSAVLNLDSGCEVSSGEILLETQVPGWPNVRSQVNLALNENGFALLSPENLFFTWPLGIEGLVIDLSKREFTCENLGENTIKLTLKKAGGESKEYSVKILVEDKTAPVLITKIPSLAFDLVKGELKLNPEDFVESLSDNCGIKTIELNKSKITCEDYDLPIELILTAVDPSGNSTSEVLTVSVSPFESQKISISPESGTQFTVGEAAEIRLGDEFAFTLLGWYRNDQLLIGEKGKAIQTDQAGTYWARLLPDGGGCAVESKKTEIIFTSLPFGQIKEKVELILGPDGKIDLRPQDVFVNWPQPDPNLEFSFSTSTFTCENIGENAVTVKIISQSGETWGRNTTVLVKDETRPVLVPKNIRLELDFTKGWIEISPENALTEFGDNCGLKSLTISKNRFTCEDVGKEFSIAIRAEDSSGNVTEAVSQVSLVRLESEKVLILGKNAICGGETSTLQLSSSKPFEVVGWKRNGTEISGQTGKTLVVSEPGKYHAVTRYPGACLSETAEFEVKVNPLPSGEISVDGNILRAPEGAFIYQWFRNGTSIPGAASRIFTAELMGNYTVELTNESGCKSKLLPVTLTISGIGGKPVNQAIELKIYPNPASDRVILELPDGLLASKPEILVYSSEGKNVSSAVQITSLNDSKVEILLNRIAKGTYLIRIVGENQKNYFGKLVVVK